MSATTETNQYTENKLFPISNGSNLVKFYEFYKKMSKDLNIKRIDSSINEFQDSIDNVISIMKTKYVDLLEKLQKSKNSAKVTDNIESANHGINLLVMFFLEIDRKNPNDPDTNRLLIKMSEAMGVNYVYLENIIRDKDAGLNRLMLLDSIRDEQGFIDNVKHVLSSFNMDFSQSGPSKEDLETIVKEYEDFQKFLLNYLNSLQVMVKEVSVNLAGTYTELRFELVKYIYQSAKLYV